MALEVYPEHRESLDLKADISSVLFGKR